MQRQWRRGGGQCAKTPAVAASTARRDLCDVAHAREGYSRRVVAVAINPKVAVEAALAVGLVVVAVGRRRRVGRWEGRRRGRRQRGRPRWRWRLGIREGRQHGREQDEADQPWQRMQRRGRRHRPKAWRVGTTRQKREQGVQALSMERVACTLRKFIDRRGRVLGRARGRHEHFHRLRFVVSQRRLQRASWARPPKLRRQRAGVQRRSIDTLQCRRSQMDAYDRRYGTCATAAYRHERLRARRPITSAGVRAGRRRQQQHRSS